METLGRSHLKTLDPPPQVGTSCILAVLEMRGVIQGSAEFVHTGPVVSLLQSCYWIPWAPSIQKVPTLGSKVCRYYLLWAFWSAMVL